MSDTFARLNDLPFLAAEAFHHIEMARSAIRDSGAPSELWEKAALGLEKAYDALQAIRRSQ